MKLVSSMIYGFRFLKSASECSPRSKTQPRNELQCSPRFTALVDATYSLSAGECGHLCRAIYNSLNYITI